MFGYILKKVRFSRLKRKKPQKEESRAQKNYGPLQASLAKNLENLRDILNNSSDIAISEFDFGNHRKAKGALIYIDGMINKELIQKSILQPLMQDALTPSHREQLDLTDIDSIKRKLILISSKVKIGSIDELMDNLLSGGTVLLVDGSKEALAVNEKKWASRGVEDPQTENLVRGPREGFTENLRTNTVLLRRRIRDPDLCLEHMEIGDRTKTEICIVYLKNTADRKLIDEVRTRLQRIHTDAILESGYIEQFIEDSSYSVFSTVANNEKPDKTAAKILEGRVAILVDGSPFALTVPMLFVESFQSSEDYYSRTLFSSFSRIIRFIAYLISVLSPAIYVALTVFHQELIPTQLLISIAAGREPVPFPAVIEAALMLLTFDILREAGVRLPKPVGSAVSIVGALVLGQSAVTAGLISPIMVIVVAATAIAGFVVPAQNDSGALLRYVFLILAGLAGGFGIIMGLLVCTVYLGSLRSFGTPYFSPVAPLSFSDLKDTIIRLPLPDILTNKGPGSRYNIKSQSDDPSAPYKKKNDEEAAKH